MILLSQHFCVMILLSQHFCVMIQTLCQKMKLIELFVLEIFPGEDLGKSGISGPEGPKWGCMNFFFFWKILFLVSIYLYKLKNTCFIKFLVSIYLYKLKNTCFIKFLVSIYLYKLKNTCFIKFLVSIYLYIN